ncbi:uncharacterized protein LOC114356295 isoform X3 [Ostrinia furnacalis]|uniref:uncharacterized protein LOC114356295 isoform X3 n=1 Tax=Ostrinia furnacalis TaxID=93504 RepID=UPI001040BCB0|nr:uncharacterized protein LOC114356295 isoform X3 [Ostrinia furnacalis]
MVYKWCVVPHCTNTSIKDPNKVFVSVPTNPKRRKMWLQLARRDPNCILTHTNVCEDHFNMETDTKNYTMYKMGFSQKILLADEAVPTKFDCQEDRKKRLSSEGSSRKAFLKRQRADLITECLQNQSVTETEKLLKDEVMTQMIEPEELPRTQDKESITKFTNSIITLEKSVQVSTKGRQRNKDSSPEESEPELESEPTLDLKIEPTDEQRPQCATCHEVILGFVFACVECNARSCSACDARGLHAAHLVLRAPVARPESQLKLVLNKIRDTLGPVIEGTPRTIPDQPVEESPQEPDEEPPQDPKEKYIIKMEIEIEEHAPFWHESASGAPANTDEETIVPDVEHQSMSWEGRDAGEEQSDSCTITASTSSKHSSRVKRVSSDKTNEKYPKANKRARRAVKKEPSDQKRPVLKKGSSDQKCPVVKKGSSDQKCPVVKKGSSDQKCPVVKKESSDQKCPEHSSGSAAQGISHSRQQTRKRRGSKARLSKTEDVEDCIKAHTIDIPPE